MLDGWLAGIIVLFFHVVVAPFAILHALLYKRDYRSALGWIGISLLFPVAGPLLYFYLGVNRLRRRARKLTGTDVAGHGTFRFEDSRTFPLADSLPENFAHPLARAGWHTTASRLIEGNAVELLINGDAFYPRLLQAIESAKQRAWISSYIFSGTGIGGEIADALIAAARRGVDARVIVDGIGTLYSFRSLERKLRDTAVKFAEFFPPRLLPPSLHWNLRNHRKIAVIDAEIGFFGGLNIDDRHFIATPRIESPHEDIHFVARGPATAALAQVFANDWESVTGEALDAGPAAPASGSVAMRVIEEGPDESMDRLSMTLLGVISGARREIRVMTPYFLPHRELVGAFQAAAVRGVRVDVLLPERSNLPYVDWASRHQLWELLKWGVHIRLKPAPFAHSKLLTVDSDYVLGGSANLDPRSLRLNFEVGVEMFDETLARQAREYFDACWQRSRIITLMDVDSRSLPARIRDGFFWLFSAYL
ncbi:MAG TPA: phospholipase D-like domain-containing protein [Gammaproteobacteria bacterium]|nr:phospholipase D-like domain-containing protein [Gammaproteobacteria bacterium]